jgi:hypothetical protein
MLAFASRLDAGATVSRPILASNRRDLVRIGLSRRVLPDEAVHRLPDEVGVADVPRILLDRVNEDTTQAG